MTLRLLYTLQGDITSSGITIFIGMCYRGRSVRIPKQFGYMSGLEPLSENQTSVGAMNEIFYQDGCEV